jgi:hypothetical protein
MTNSEYKAKIIVLEKQIEFNKRIHCNLVAARYERQLAAFKEEYKELAVQNEPHNS